MVQRRLEMYCPTGHPPFFLPGSLMYIGYCYRITIELHGGYTLPETNSAPLKIGRDPKGKLVLHLHWQTTSFREGTCKHTNLTIHCVSQTV